jgi:hypothetical protein
MMDIQGEMYSMDIPGDDFTGRDDFIDPAQALRQSLDVEPPWKYSCQALCTVPCSTPAAAIHRWSVGQCCEWLSRIELPQYRHTFEGPPAHCQLVQPPESNCKPPLPLHPPRRSIT